MAVLENGTARTFHAGRRKTVTHRQELRKKAGCENAESSFPQLNPAHYWAQIDDIADLDQAII